MDNLTPHIDNTNQTGENNENSTPPRPAESSSPINGHGVNPQPLNHVDQPAPAPTPPQPAPQPQPAQILTQNYIKQHDAATATVLEASPAAGLANKSKRFLIAYLTTIFSGMALLWSAVFLGGVLFNQFFGPKDDGSSFFDPAGIYVTVMSAMITFGALYLVASRYVAKSAANDTIGLKDWRVYKLVYAVFAALLLLSAASVLAALLYIPIAQISVTDDLQPKQITVTILTSIHALLWIALLLWQERLVKHGKASWLQGTIVVVAALVIVVLTGIFPIGSKTNDRYDARASSDLSSIQDKIDTYVTAHNETLPTSLSALSFGDDAVGRRLSDYTYTPHQVSTSSSSTGASLFDNSYSTDSTSDYYSTLNDSTDYSTTSATSTYELCATFKTDTTNDTSNSLFGALTGTTSTSTSAFDTDFTNHKTGHVCFERE